MYTDPRPHSQGDSVRSPFRFRSRPSTAQPRSSPALIARNNSGSGFSTNSASVPALSNSSFSPDPCVHRSADGGIMVHLSSGRSPTSHVRRQSSMDLEDRSTNRDRNFLQGSFKRRGSPLVGHRLAGADSSVTEEDNGGFGSPLLDGASHYKSMSSLPVPNPHLHVSHSRERFGRSLDAADPCFSSSFYAPSSTVNNGSSIRLLQTLTDVYSPEERTNSSSKLGTEQAETPVPQTRFTGKNLHTQFGKLAGTSFSASFH